MGKTSSASAPALVSARQKRTRHHPPRTLARLALARIALGAALALVWSVASMAAETGTGPEQELPPEEIAAIVKSYSEIMQTGHHFNSMGDFESARQRYEDALSLCESKLGHDAPVCVEPVIRLALEFSNLGRFRQSEALLNRAEQTITVNDLVERAPLLETTRAIIFANSGHYEDAYHAAEKATGLRRDALRAALATSTANNDETLARSLADTAHGLLIMGNMALLTGRLDEAEAMVTMARGMMQTTSLEPEWWAAVADEVTAMIEYERDSLDVSRRRQERVLAVKQASLGDTRYVAESKLALGRVLSSLEQLDQGLGQMREAMRTIEERRRGGLGLSREQAVGFMDAAARRISQDNALRTSLIPEMILAAQLVRSGTTEKVIAETAARLSVGVPGARDLIETQQKTERLADTLRLALGQELARPEAERDGARIAFFAKGLSLAREKVKANAAELGRVFPEYDTLINDRPVPLAALQQVLNPREGLLVLLNGRNNSIAMLMTRDEVHIHRSDLGSGAVAETVANLRKAFKATGAGIQPFDMQASWQLFRGLIGDIAPRLAGLEQLSVTTQGALSSFPPALFVTSPPPPGENYRAARWLIDDLALTSLPSVQAFHRLRSLKGGSTASRMLLALADPPFRGGAASGSGLEEIEQKCPGEGPFPASLLRSLAPLPETNGEVNAIAAALKNGGASTTDLLIGARANEAALRRASLSDYRMLYFATHGLLPGELSCQPEPALTLAPQDRAGTTEEDGLLTATEIAALDLNADLVVLSACNTAGGSGGQFGGNALSGLAESFFIAGARGMLVSHWQVDSRATQDLMTALFRQASSQHSALAPALRDAALSVKSSYNRSHPFFWAAFTLVGDGARTLTIRTAAKAQ